MGGALVVVVVGQQRLRVGSIVAVEGLGCELVARQPLPACECRIAQ